MNRMTCRTTWARKALLTIGITSVYPALGIRHSEDNHSHNWAIAATVGACAAAAGLACYGIYKACSPSLEDARSAYQKHARAVQKTKRTCCDSRWFARLTDQQLLDIYGTDVVAYQRDLKTIHTHLGDLRTIERDLHTIYDTWHRTREAALLLDDVRATQKDIQCLSDELHKLVVERESRECLLEAASVLGGESGERSMRLTICMDRYGVLDTQDVEQIYGAERFVYLTAFKETQQRVNVYRVHTKHLEKLSPASTVAARLAHQVEQVIQRYTRVLQELAVMRGYKEDKVAHQEYEFRCREQERMQQELALKERQIRQEQDRLAQERYRADQLDRELRLRAQELAQKEQDMILRGAELIAHAGCAQRERDLSCRLEDRDRSLRALERTISERNDRVKQLERDICHLRRELEDIKTYGTSKPVCSSYYC